MFGRLARRAIELSVALFALLGFCFVPLGEKTALQHAGAILRTDAAKEAARELGEATRRVRKKLFDEIDRPAPQPAVPPLIAAEPADAGAPDASLPWQS